MIRAVLYELEQRGYEVEYPQGLAPLRVDLGCGDGKPAGFVGIDVKPGPGVDIVFDLEQGIPLPDACADVVRAYHVLEHLSDKERIMSEVWRVLKPGGRFVFEVPSTKGEGAFAHPGHKSYWNRSSFLFWVDDKVREDRPKFDVERLDERRVGDLVYVSGVLVKPAPEGVSEAMRPIMRYAMPKPRMGGSAHTEAFKPDEVWPWVEKHLKNGIVSEPKMNGIRVSLQKKGSRVSVFFEDSQQDRTIPGVNDRLATVPGDFMLDANIGVVENGKPWPRYKLMALTKKKVDLGDARPLVTVFDLVYWDEDVSEKPFKERRKLLEQFYRKHLKAIGFAITPQMRVTSRKSLAAAWRAQQKYPSSEGVVLKDLEAPYDIGGTDAMAKLKVAVELKVKVLGKRARKGGLWGYQGGLLLGGADFSNIKEVDGEKYVNLGWSYNTKVSASVGDIMTFAIQELIVSHNKVSWLGAKAQDVDKTRREPYYVNQAIDIARRGGVLQKAEAESAQDAKEVLREPETRHEAAVKWWAANWYKVWPLSGHGRFVYQYHFRGLSEDEAKHATLEELLRTNHSVHGDLRLEDRGGLWGFTVFTGTTENIRRAGGCRLANLPPDDKLQGTFKLRQPREWLTITAKGPYIVPPLGAVATTQTWAKFFQVDAGTYDMGVWREHSLEVFLHGDKLKGRHIIQFAPVGGGRKWLISKPASQKPYADSHDLDKVKSELAAKGQRHLVWAKPGQKPQHILVAHTEEGGPGSGHWGHLGDPPNRGGSKPGGGVQYRLQIGGKYVGVGKIDRSDPSAVVKALQGIGVSDKLRAIDTKLERLYTDIDRAMRRRQTGKTTQERIEASLEVRRLNDQVEELQAKKFWTEETQRQQRLSLLSAPQGPGHFPIEGLKSAPVKTGVEFVEAIIGKGSGLDGLSVKVSSAVKSRPHFRDSNGTMYICEWRGTQSVAHEMGHWVEYHDTYRRMKARVFLRSRTRGEEAKWLGDKYAKDEVGKRDEFMDPYMGKIYDDGATEIISMGLEYLYSKPVEFAKKDPEYVQWLLETLRG